MDTKRTTDEQRERLDLEPRRAAGSRVAAALAVVGLVTMMALNGPQSGADNGVRGMQTETYGLEVPAIIEDEYRRETVAVAPATGQYEEPEMIVNYEVYG